MIAVVMGADSAKHRNDLVEKLMKKHVGNLTTGIRKNHMRLGEVNIGEYDFVVPSSVPVSIGRSMSLVKQESGYSADVVTAFKK